MTVTSGYRRHARASDGRATYVHLLTPRPVWKEGDLEMPAKWVGEVHSNEAHKRDQYVFGAVNRWLDWWQKRGWEQRGEVQIMDPHQARAAFEDFPDDEMVTLPIRCQFILTRPECISLEDFLHVRDLADRYQVDFEDGTLERNILPVPKKLIELPPGEGLDDPMQLARERRDELGLNKAELQYDEEELDGQEA